MEKIDRLQSYPTVAPISWRSTRSFTTLLPKAEENVPHHPPPPPVPPEAAVAVPMERKESHRENSYPIPVESAGVQFTPSRTPTAFSL